MLKIENLTKNFGSHEALKGVNLEVKAKEVYCLLGANGAGKSTTINILLNFILPSGGSVFINNINVLQNPLLTKKHLAYIPEIVMLYPSLTGIENLDFFSQLAGFTYEESELELLLIKAGLQAEAHHTRLNNYSKGMRQKVGIAIAMAKKAGLLIMDEPTSGLDPKAIEEFSLQVKQFASEGGAVLMATHDIFNAVAIGTRIGIMKQGKIIHELKAADITANDLQKLYLETI